ncbi:MAG: Ig-like domain-containing protein [Thermoplasmata archaeon]
MQKWFVIIVFMLLTQMPAWHVYGTTLESVKPSDNHEKSMPDNPKVSGKSNPEFSDRPIDPELLGTRIENGSKIRVYIATENIDGLGKELRALGINVSFGIENTYSKLIYPVIDVWPWQIPRIEKLSNALFVGKYPDLIKISPEKKFINSSSQSHTPYTGNNTTTLILTDGIEFGLPVLANTYAIWENASPYAGFPQVFDFASIYDYLEDGMLSNHSWFADTHYNATAYVKNNSIYIDFDNCTYDVTGIPSVSSTFHIGYMPYNGSKGDKRIAVITTDASTLWDYDTVFVDTDGDFSFRNEQPLRRGSPIATKDLNGDGLPDISTGLLYWISDGNNPLPYGRFVAERFGFKNLVPEKGSLLCFFGDFGNGTGTQIAEAILSCANQTKILPVVVKEDTNIFEAWTFCAYGADYLPRSGDEGDVCLSNFVFKAKTNYWGYLTSLLSDSRVLFVFPAISSSEGPSSIYGIYAGAGIIAGNGNIVSADTSGTVSLLASGYAMLHSSFAQSQYQWNNSVESYSGSCISAAFTAGVIAKLVEIVKSHGHKVNPDKIRENLASACENTLLASTVQGSGWLNETLAVSIENYSADTLCISPRNLVFGDYGGIAYPSFSNLVYAGNNYSKNITLLNLNTDKQITIFPEKLNKTSAKGISFRLEANSSGFLSITDLIDKTAAVIQVAITASDGVRNTGSIDVEMYAWFDYNGNFVEDPGEIEMLAYTLMKEGIGALNIGIKNWTSMEGVFLKFTPKSETTALNFCLSIEFFAITSFDWIKSVSAFIPANFAMPCNLNLSVPADALPGIYTGKLLISSDNFTKAMPYEINVGMYIDNLYNLSDANYTGNSVVAGVHDSWFYIDIPQNTSTMWTYVVLSVHATDELFVEHYLLYPDVFSILYRKTFGPGTMLSTTAFGYFAQATDNANESTIFLPLVEGLNAIRFCVAPGAPSSEILMMHLFTMAISGDAHIESVWWTNKFELSGIASGNVNISATAMGLECAKEYQLTLNTSEVAEIRVVLNETVTFICNAENAWVSLYLVDENCTEILAYSSGKGIFIPRMVAGNYALKVYAGSDVVANLSWVLVYGNNVSANVLPEGNVPPYMDFYIGVELPHSPSQPGTYYSVLALSLGNTATPCLIPLSEKLLDLPPYFTDFSPELGTVQKEVKIYGKYEDSEGTLKSYVSCLLLYINGANYTNFCIWNATEFSLPILLDEGNYSLIVEIYDANGMKNRTETWFTIDRTAPYLRVTAPEDYFLTKERHIFVTGECSQDATVYVNQHLAESNGVGTFFCEIILFEGWNLIEIKAVDNAGNTAIDYRKICLDSTPPPLIVLAPENGAVLKSSYVSVYGLTEAGATVTVNGANARVEENGRFSVGIELGVEGENLITAVARDAAGNENTATMMLVLDRTPPQLILNPYETLTSNPVFTLSGVIRDANPENYVIVNSMKVMLSNQRFSVSILLSEGENTIRISAMDVAGNVNSRYFTVTLDTTPPPLNLSLPQTVTNPQITINGSTEPGAKLFINNVSVYVDAKGNFSYQLNLTKGVNFITVNLTDTIGNNRVLTFAVLYVNPDDLNVDDMNRFKDIDKKITEMMDALVYAILGFIVILIVAIVGVYKYILWKAKKTEEPETLKKIFESE